MSAPPRTVYLTVSCAITECVRDRDAAATVSEEFSGDSLAPQPTIPSVKAALSLQILETIELQFKSSPA